jgi:hypothetical protein
MGLIASPPMQKSTLTFKRCRSRAWHRWVVVLEKTRASCYGIGFGFACDQCTLRSFPAHYERTNDSITLTVASAMIENFKSEIRRFLPRHCLSPVPLGDFLRKKAFSRNPEITVIEVESWAMRYFWHRQTFDPVTMCLPFQSSSMSKSEPDKP